jgi:UTP--glucose-1-phosphate uridylyltransferase
MRLDAVDRLCKNGKIEDMEIIINEKSLSNGTNVIQLETASGAAIKVHLI